MFQEDVRAFFSIDGFAEDAVCKTKASGYSAANTIRVIFDYDYKEINLGIVAAEGNGPSALCISDDVSTMVDGDKMVVRGTDYYVQGQAKNLGDGTSRIELSQDLYEK